MDTIAGRRCLQRTIGHPTPNAVASLRCSLTPSSRNSPLCRTRPSIPSGRRSPCRRRSPAGIACRWRRNGSTSTASNRSSGNASRHSCKRNRPSPTSSRKPTRKPYSGNFRRRRRSGTRGQRGSQEDFSKVRDRGHASQSATQAVPSRHHPRRRSHLARRVPGSVTECQRHGGYRDGSNACNDASDGAWHDPFSGPVQGVSATDDPFGGFPARQPVFR